MVEKGVLSKFLKTISNLDAIIRIIAHIFIILRVFDVKFCCIYFEKSSKQEDQHIT